MVKVDIVSRDGRPTTFAGVPAGAWFGEGAVLRSDPRPYSVVAVRDSRVAFVPRSTFEWLLDDSRSFNRFVVDQLNIRCGYYIAVVVWRHGYEATAPSRIYYDATNLAFNRPRPWPMLSERFISSGLLGVISAAHSQKEAINAALSGDNLESASPDSMMGISIAAARNRFSSGVDMGRNLGIQKV